MKIRLQAERERGFSAVLEKNNVHFKKYASDYTYEGGYKTAKKIIAKKQIPAGFFVANDIMALGVVDALRESSIVIPTETKVIGFDNIEMTAWPTYNLTTWEQPITEMVERTVKYLMAEIVEFSGYTENVEINGGLIVRKTT